MSSAHLDNNLNAKDWAEAFLAENKGKKVTKETIQVWFQRALLTGTICGAGLKAHVDSGGNIYTKVEEFKGSERKVDNSDCKPFADQIGGGHEEAAVIYEDRKDEVKEMKAEFEKSVANSPNSFKTPIFEDRLPSDPGKTLEAPISVAQEGDVIPDGKRFSRG